MKTALRISGDCNGSVLMVTVVTGVLIGIVLASYLTLVRNQNATVARAQDWNAAMGAAEAGVEEALAQLNNVPLTTNIVRSANGWVLDAGSYRVPAPRALLHGTYNVRFTDVGQPVIYATGAITSAALGTTLSRTIEVRTTNAPVYNVGMAALQNIKMNGNNIFTDSYNSTDPRYSTNGLYTNFLARANCTVASLNGVVGVGNGTINGNLLTGPLGSYSVLNGAVTGTYFNDFNAEYQDVKPPANLASFLGPTANEINRKLTNAAGGVLGIKTYAYAFLASGSYILPGSGFSGAVYVGPAATNVTVYVKDNVNLNDNLYIAPGGKLTFYMAGPTFKVAAVVNGGTPAQFSYLGLPSNNQVQFVGSGALTGTVYAPQAQLSMGGGGNSIGFCGACVVKSVNMNGNMTFHYDESLATWGPTTYKAASWREL